MNLPRSPVRRGLVVALLMSVVVGAIHVAACWYSVAPNGSDFLYKHVSWFFPTYLILFALYNVLYVIVDAVGLLFGRRKTTWREVGARTVFCGFLFVLMFVIVGLGESVRNAGYRGITRRGARLVTAIKQYQTAHGALPNTLDALVPECLPAIPDTGVGAYPNYEFIQNKDSTRYGGNRWVLSVDVSTDDLTRDALLFYPDGKYPSGLWVTRFGNWALISTPVKSNGNRD